MRSFKSGPTNPVGLKWSPRETQSSSTEWKWSPAHKVSPTGGLTVTSFPPLVRRRLSELGMSGHGINQLLGGRPLSNPNDRVLVAMITAEVLSK